LSALLEAGIRTFVDLTDEDEINEDAKPVPRYRALLRGLAAEQRTEITYLRVPIEDRGIPSVWTMRFLLDVIDRSMSDENAVFVHCWAGRGRTGTVVGCYLKRHGLADQQEVIQKIAALRRKMPCGTESSPHTLEQVRMVRHWKQGV
jgi:protein-tyrosine phosphatase